MKLTSAKKDYVIYGFMVVYFLAVYNTRMNIQKFI